MTASLTWALRSVAAAVFLLLLVGLQELLPRMFDDYIYDVAVLAGINIILAVSLNLINGVTGQFSLGHAGFMAVGAYTAAAFTFYAGPRLILLPAQLFVVALILAAIASGFAGLLVGLPSLRLRGDYLAIVTLGFGQIIISIIRTIREIGEARGFTGLPQLTSFAWVFALAALCILMVRNLADSAPGRSMKAVREDEVAAEAVGVATTRIKVTAFVLSAMWAGVAGALHAHHMKGAYPDSFTFQRSVDVVVMVVLGGLGSITGATLAAIALKILEEVLRNLSGALWTGVGVILFALALSLPRHRARFSEGPVKILNWLLWPSVAMAAWILLFQSQQQWLVNNVSALRYVIYSVILIVLMLLRPQGLLGRSELSWNLMNRKAGPAAPTPAVATGTAQTEPVDEGVEGTL